MLDSSAAIQADVSSRIGISLLKKAQDVEKFEGDAVVSLIKAAAKLAQGSARGAVAELPGPEESGAQLDVAA